MLVSIFQFKTKLQFFYLRVPDKNRISDSDPKPIVTESNGCDSRLFQAVELLCMQIVLYEGIVRIEIDIPLIISCYEIDTVADCSLFICFVFQSRFMCCYMNAVENA
jgi:hypothetical protein